MVLELDLADSPPIHVGQPIRLRATYRAQRPVLIFHRMVMGWAPDELELHIDGPNGRRISDRVTLSSPKVLPITPQDFVRVTPDHPCRFEFPLWSDTPLDTGAYSVRAHRPSLAWLETAPESPGEVDRTPLTSNAIDLLIEA